MLNCFSGYRQELPRTRTRQIYHEEDGRVHKNVIIILVLDVNTVTFTRVNYYTIVYQVGIGYGIPVDIGQTRVLFETWLRSVSADFDLWQFFGDRQG